MISPPKRALAFLRWFCREEYLDEIEGDLTELFKKHYAHSPGLANWQFIWQMLKYFRPEFLKVFKNHQSNSTNMLKNYLTITFRIFNREKQYSLINISGLALGFTCCLMIYLFIRDEISYDKFHENGDRIYRVAAAYMRQGQWEPYSTNSWRTGELIRDNYKELEELVMFTDADEIIFAYQDKKIEETRVAWAGDNFFRVFTFPLIQGNPAEALKGTNKVVISESAAAKYFGSEQAMGKVFQTDDGNMPLEVSGVMKDMPPNSHFHFDFLISGETLKQYAPENLFTQVGWDSQYIYIKTAPGTDPKMMEATFPAFIDKNLDYLKSNNFKLFLQPLQSIHLESNIGTELETNGKLSQVYTFSLIAVFILVIACVNYVNLTTARSLRRAKEVGMRKVMGGMRIDLLKQFLTESFIMTIMAVLLAIAFTLFLLPAFNQFTGKEIPRMILFNGKIMLTLLVSLVIIGLISGFYPALVLSSFKSSHNVKSADQMGKAGFIFRRGLVVLQFVISIGLIAALAIVFEQWEFMKNKPLGINKEMLVAIPLQTMDRSKVVSFTELLSTDPAVKKVGSSNMRMPGWIGSSTPYIAEGVERDDEAVKTMKLIQADAEFLNAIEAKLVAGRNFSKETRSDSAALILNESAVAQLGWTEPIGRWMQIGRRQYTVIGIVKDFHFESLHRKIPPIIFMPTTTRLNWVYARIDNQNVSGTMSRIKDTYTQFVTDRDFSYTFVDEDIERQYQGEAKFTKTFTIFTVLAIIIACLGTFGLISFAAERKSKEIGIRKVLGASVGNVSFLLIKEFIFLLVIAGAIALPLTWYFLDNWIETFVYRISIGAEPFVLAIVLAVCIVVVTTGFRAIKAGLSNPVDSLRDE